MRRRPLVDGLVVGTAASITVGFEIDSTRYSKIVITDGFEFALSVEAIKCDDVVLLGED